MREGLYVWFRLHQRCDGVRRSDGMDQPGSGTKRCAGRQTESAGHSGTATDDNHSTALALMGTSPKVPLPLGGLGVGNDHRPQRIWRRMTDVGHDDCAHFIAGQKVPPSNPAEGDA